MSNCSQELQAPLVLNHSTVWTPHLNIFFGPDRWFSHRPILMNNYYIQNPLLQVKSFGHKMHQCYNKCIQDSVNSMNGNPVERLVKGWLPSYNRKHHQERGIRASTSALSLPCWGCGRTCVPLLLQLLGVGKGDGIYSFTLLWHNPLSLFR